MKHLLPRPTLEDDSAMKGLAGIASVLLFMSIYFMGVKGLSKGPIVTHIVWMEFEVSDQPVGRVKLGLFGRSLPVTTENFRLLIEGGFPPKGYKGSGVNRIGYSGGAAFLVQGGRICRQCSTQGQTAFAEESFIPAESFKFKHSHPGRLGMANGGVPNSTSSHWYITLQPAPQLDGEFVLFGQVLEGMGVLRNISSVPVTPDEAPKEKIVVSDCGSEQLVHPFHLKKWKGDDEWE